MNINNARTDLEIIRNTDIFYRKLTHNGSSNLCVNGSVTPVEFIIEDENIHNFIFTRADF